MGTGDGLLNLVNVEYVTGSDLTGDYNGGGQVEQGDLDLVLLNWGAAGTPAPANWVNDLPEGLIDQAELDKVLLNWGSTAALAATAAVPEPSSALLLLLAALAAWRATPKRKT